MAISSPIKPSTFVVSARIKELRTINVLSKKLYQEKRNRYVLERRLYKLEQRSLERRQYQEREATQESKKKVSVKSSVKKFIKGKAEGLGSFLFDLLQFFVTYKIVEWVGKPENKKKVLAITKALKGIFDFLNWFVTGTIDNAFSGLHSVLFGENLLERFLGFFRLVIGLLGFRYLLKPGKLFKDLGFVIKNSGKILDVFKAFTKSGIKEGATTLLKTLPKTAAIFKRGLTRGITRGVLKIFGKGGVRLLSKVFGFAFKQVKNIVLGPIKAISKTTVKGIPIVGPLLDLGINLVLGDPIDKAIVKAVGSALGMGLGGLIGSALPGPGTIVGGALGGLLGDWAADKLYGWVKGLFAKKDNDIPQLAVGGIVTQPTKAIIGEAGPEAVIPLPQLLSGSIFSGPLGILGSSIIGGVNAVLFSMGSIGNIIRPFAQQLFAPFTRDFGTKRFTFASSLGKGTSDTSMILSKKGAGEPDDKKLKDIVGGDKKVNLISRKQVDKKSRYNTGNSIRELLADIFNNIVNLETTTPGTGAPGRSGDKNVNTSGSFNGSANAEKAFNYLRSKGLTAEQAAGLVGNFMQEAGINIDPKITNSIGHVGIAQWDPNDRWPKLVRFARSKNLDPKTLEAQLQFVWYELETGDGGLSLPTLKSAKTVKQAAHLFVKQYERSGEGPGDHGYENRITYGNQVYSKYAKMQTGGAVSRGSITSHFANKESFRKHKHEGVDIGFPTGTPLSFASKGEFIKVSRTSSTDREANGGYGSYMDVRLEGNKIARLAHLSSIPSWVKSGGKFNENAVIALSGGAKGAAGSGRSNGPHLHLEQHTALKGLEETLNGKIDPVTSGVFSLLRQGGSSSSTKNPPATITEQPAVDSSSVPSSNSEEQDSSWSSIVKDLNALYKGLTGVPKTDGALLQRNSMDMIQTQNIVSQAFTADTYIIAPPTTIASTVNVIGPLPQNDFASNTSFAAFDSSSNYLQRRL